jgi:ABC-type transport system involved in multi-copper enzyme maturation permease subunit
MSAPAEKPVEKKKTEKNQGAGAGKAGVVVDRGYQPYRGAHTAQSSRWQVIARRTLGLQARKPWIIVMLVLCACWTVGLMGVMYVMSRLSGLAPSGSKLAGGSPDALVLFIAASPGGTLLLAFMVALFAGGSAVADDTRAGAFQFYFARPITRGQYLAGKLVAATTLTAMVTLAPALLLALFRLATTQTGAELWQRLPLVAAAIATGLIEALALAAPALALSSLSRSRGYAQGSFAALFLLPWMLGGIFVRVTGSAWPALGSLPAHFANLGRFLHRQPPPDDERVLPVWASLVVVAALVAGSIALLRQRLDSVEVVAS